MLQKHALPNNIMGKISSFVSQHVAWSANDNLPQDVTTTQLSASALRTTSSQCLSPINHGMLRPGLTYVIQRVKPKSRGLVEQGATISQIHAHQDQMRALVRVDPESTDGAYLNLLSTIPQAAECVVGLS